MKTVTVRKTFLNDGKVVRPGTDDQPNRITITNSRALALAKRGMVGDVVDAEETSDDEKREQFAAGLPKARISSDPESDTVTIVFPTREIAAIFREQFALMQRHAGELVRPSTGAITSESFDLTGGADGDDDQAAADDQEGADDDTGDGDDAGASDDQTGGDDQDAGGPADDKPGDAGDTTGSESGAGDVVIEKPGDETQEKPGDEKPGDAGDTTGSESGAGDVVIEKPGDETQEKPGDEKPGDNAPAPRRPRGKKPDAG